jgi:hypothetical protein
MIAIGIDCTSGSHTFTYAALDRELRLVNLAEAELEGLTAFVSGEDATRVAVNAPSHVNAGIVRKRLASRSGDSRGVRGAEIREAEHDLHARGISVTSTPRLEALCQGWVQLGFGLYRRLEDLNFRPYPANDSPRQWLETHPHAGFCALLGRLPLAKPSLEGRLQRALALFERGVRIHDPMAFLEEITRHRLLHGLLPMEFVLTTEQLDAILAAYTAWLTEAKPHEVSQLGNKYEGFITLPAPQLQEKY